MFGSIGWGEILVLIVAGLVILGPERLPGAITWVSKSLRQVRAFAQDASGQLRDQLGPELSDLHEPIQQLNKLRRSSPSSFISQHLFDGESPRSLFDPFAASSEKPTPSKPAPPSGDSCDSHTPTSFDSEAT